jgi:hypothetical protein
MHLHSVLCATLYIAFDSGLVSPSSCCCWFPSLHFIVRPQINPELLYSRLLVMLQEAGIQVCFLHHRNSYIYTHDHPTCNELKLHTWILYTHDHRLLGNWLAQMAAFMGCESGEVEIGMSTAPTCGSSPMSLESTLQQVFSEDFFQQSLLEELLQLPPTRPSSPSVSVGSPAADALTSLPRTMAATPTPSSSVERRAPPVPPPPPPHARPPVFPVPFARHGPAGHVRFPSADTDDAAMAQAMLDVISGASSSSALPTPPSTATAPPPPGKHHRARRRRGAATAFRAYNAALAPRAPWRPPGVPGQRMIKMGISILRRMHMLRFSRERTGTTMAQRGQEGEDDLSSPAVPTSSQLNHMISERRRRERLNESFEALRGLLPPGSKVNSPITA